MVIIELNTAQLFQLGVTTHDLHALLPVRIRALPHRHSGSPEAVAAEVPVRRTLDSFGKATMFDMPREPIDVFVLLQHVLALPGNVHEPAWVRSVHELRTAAVTVRVFVANVLYFERLAFSQQRLSNIFVHVPYVLAFPRAFCVVPVFVHN